MNKSFCVQRLDRNAYAFVTVSHVGIGGVIKIRIMVYITLERFRGDLYLICFLKTALN